MASLPAPVRAGLGLLAYAVENLQQFLDRAPDLPAEAVGNTLQLSMKAQQRYTELVAKGDDLLGHLRGAPEDAPSWATFDEDDDTAAAPAEQAPSATAPDDAADVDTAGSQPPASSEPVPYPRPEFGDAEPESTQGDPLLSETPAGSRSARTTPAKRAPDGRAPDGRAPARRTPRSTELTAATPTSDAEQIMELRSTAPRRRPAAATADPVGGAAATLAATSAPTPAARPAKKAAKSPAAPSGRTAGRTPVKAAAPAEAPDDAVSDTGDTGTVATPPVPPVLD